MSASPVQVRANRLNSLASTGPRTAAGLVRSSRNALKAGLFSKLLILPLLGESVENFDAFRAGIIEDLNPTGAVEFELAERIVGLMWRLRRVARYESAAMAATIGDLPAHPDIIEPLSGNEQYLPVPPGAPITFRLAHLRARMTGSCDAINSRRAGANALDDATDVRSPVEASAVGRILDAATDELAWPVAPDPWPAVLTAAGFKRSVSAVEWTVGRVYRVLETAAGIAKRDGDELRKAVHEHLCQAAEELERAASERRAEETRLVTELLRERERTAAARIYADEGLGQRVARAEGHLSRELDRALALLAHHRAERVHQPAAVRSVEFVLQPELPARGAG